jgi:hypothetical protein
MTIFQVVVTPPEQNEKTIRRTGISGTPCKKIPNEYGFILIDTMRWLAVKIYSYPPGRAPWILKLKLRLPVNDSCVLTR